MTTDFNTQRRMQLLIERVADYAIYLLNPDGTVASWNAGARRFKGYTEAEIIGQHFSRFYTPADRAAGVPERALSRPRSPVGLGLGARTPEEVAVSVAAEIVALRRGGSRGGRGP